MQSSVHLIYIQHFSSGILLHLYFFHWVCFWNGGLCRYKYLRSTYVSSTGKSALMVCVIFTWRTGCDCSALTQTPNPKRRAEEPFLNIWCSVFISFALSGLKGLRVLWAAASGLDSYLIPVYRHARDALGNVRLPHLQAILSHFIKS